MSVCMCMHAGMNMSTVYSMLGHQHDDFIYELVSSFTLQLALHHSVVLHRTFMAKI